MSKYTETEGLPSDDALRDSLAEAKGRLEKFGSKLEQMMAERDEFRAAVDKLVVEVLKAVRDEARKFVMLWMVLLGLAVGIAVGRVLS